MGIKIYTYSNPYKLNKEFYWNDLKDAAYFCSSDVLKRAMIELYRDDFKKNNISTVTSLINNLYDKWESTRSLIEQHTYLDQAIHNVLANYSNTETVNKNIENALYYNRDDIFKSIRILFELKIDVNDIDDNKLNKEQLFLVDLYKHCYEFMYSAIPDSLTEDEINAAIKKTLTDSEYGYNDEIRIDTIVFQGIHQFTPIMLRAIEELSKNHEVIMIFNYQPQYKKIYQTWLNVYSFFNENVNISDVIDFLPIDKSSKSYDGNLLAKNMGNLIEGKMIKEIKPFQVLQFDNTTEFASYVARLYKKSKEKANNKKAALALMSQHFYAADSSVNDILKVYFPDQYGERDFLNYPLGHFFIAVANMWSTSDNEMVIEDLNDIKECLVSSIIHEKKKGELLSIFSKVEPALIGVTKIQEMIEVLENVENLHKSFNSSEQKTSAGYLDVSEFELEKLKNALQEIEKLASEFYEDFDKHKNNFAEFYSKLQKYLQKEIKDTKDINEEYKSILTRVLNRLEEVKDINVSASFECLKSTMSIYLQQEQDQGKGSNWIVRNFEQIEGDVLLTKLKPNSVYHFAAVSDEDISCVKHREFPWPLDEVFFEEAQVPGDWKYQVYSSSCREYRNFKRYALMYGLQFNQGFFKLSFIKGDGNHNRNLYYIFKLLGAEIKEYKDFKIGSNDTKEISYEIDLVTPHYELDDFMRYKSCSYKYYLESLGNGKTLYRDNFLIKKYFEVLIEDRVLEENSEEYVDKEELKDLIDEAYDDLKKYFIFVKSDEEIDIKRNVKKALIYDMSRNSRLPKYSSNQFLAKELFIKYDNRNSKISLADISSTTKERINEYLLKELKNEDFNTNPQLHEQCKWCAQKEICAYGVLDNRNKG